MARACNYINFHRDSPLQCENLVLMCFDFRFRKGISDLLPHAGFSEFDLISLPGASRSLVNEDIRETALRAIRLAMDLHGVRRVILVDHEDCAACGGSKAFAGSEDEETFHAGSLREAAAILREAFDGIEVVTLYAGWWHMKPVE